MLSFVDNLGIQPQESSENFRIASHDTKLKSSRSVFNIINFWWVNGIGFVNFRIFVRNHHSYKIIQ